MAAIDDRLEALRALCARLDAHLGDPSPPPAPPPGHDLLHPDLVAVLTTGLSAWAAQGVDLERVQEMTDKASTRGLRRSVFVFGWHPDGHTWLGAPMYHKGASTVLKIDRVNRLEQTELTLAEFLDDVIAQTQATLDKIEATPETPEPSPESEPEAPAEAPRKKARRVRVQLPDSDGATLTVGERSESFTGEEFAYIRWSLEAMQMLSDDAAPDLSAWDQRALRRARLDAIPAEGDPTRAAYRQTWLSISRRDRMAPAAETGKVAGHKLTASGEWILHPAELDVLRRSGKAKAPRHTPSDEQAAIWRRFIALCDADEVTVHVP